MATWLDVLEPKLSIDPARANCLLASGDWTFQNANVLLGLLANKFPALEGVVDSSV